MNLTGFSLNNSRFVMLLVGLLMGGDDEGPRFGRGARLLLLLSGLLVAVVPFGSALYLGRPALAVPAALISGLLAVATVAAAAMAGRHPLPAVAVIGAATALFVAGFAAVFLPRLGPDILGPRAARRAVELREPGERIVVFERRDDDLYFYLPLDATTCRTAGCVKQSWLQNEFLGIAREGDFSRLRPQMPAIHLEVVERVEGVDLTHLREEAVVLFRAAARPVDRGPQGRPRKH